MSPRIKRINRIDRPGFKPRKKYTRPEPVRGDFVANLEDPRVTEVFARLGRNPKDYKTAKRVVTLQEQYPQGTIPELVTMDYLNQQQIEHTFQAWVHGGRSRRGGQIPDFVLEYNGRGMAWLIQGSYWHSRPDVAASDVSDKLSLVGTWFEHVFIEEVIELWEDDIYEDRPEVFEMALLGVGLRGAIGVTL